MLYVDSAGVTRTALSIFHPGLEGLERRLPASESAGMTNFLLEGTLLPIQGFATSITTSHGKIRSRIATKQSLWAGLSFLKYSDTANDRSKAVNLRLLSLEQLNDMMWCPISTM